jgi:hypothetical protein
MEEITYRRGVEHCTGCQSPGLRNDDAPRHNSLHANHLKESPDKRYLNRILQAIVVAIAGLEILAWTGIFEVAKERGYNSH